MSLLDDLAAAQNEYDSIQRAKGGDYGEAYNEASRRRGTSAEPQRVLVERIGQAADRPELAAAAPAYELMKGFERGLGVPVLSKTIDVLGLPQGWKPGVGTSPASARNVLAALLGAKQRLMSGGVPR